MKELDARERLLIAKMLGIGYQAILNHKTFFGYDANLQEELRAAEKLCDLMGMTFRKVNVPERADKDPDEVPF